MIKIRLILLSILALLYSNFSFSQDLLFHHLRTQDGLSQTTILSSYQDEFGQIWIGTRDGLNKYNGNRIEAYRSTTGETAGVLNSSIDAITGDRKGKIYIQSLGKLVLYDLILQKFRVIRESGVSALYQGKGKLWFAEQSIIKYLDQTTGKLVDFRMLDPQMRVTSLLEDAKGNLYAGTDMHGLLLVDNNSKAINVIDNISVVQIYEDMQKQLWVGSREHGLFLIDSKNEISNYKHKAGKSKSISSNFVRAICQDNLGVLWLGTSEGLNSFNLATEEFKSFAHKEDDIYSLANSSVLSITKDMQGLLWIGTYFGGVDIYNPEHSFTNFYHVTGNNRGLNSPIVSNTIEDKDGNLWIGTDNKGLNFLDRKSNTFTYYTHDAKNKNSLSANGVKALLLDEENQCLWIGTNLGGLNKLDLSTKRIERINLNTGDRNIDNFVRAIVKYKNYLLLGTHESVQCYDIKTGKTTPLISEENGLDYFKITQIWDMMIDSNECLWYSGIHNVYTCDLKLLFETGEYKLNNKSNIASATFFEDSKNRIWVSSVNKGLGLLNRETDSLEFFNTDNSDLIDNYLVAIGESPMGYLLVATNRGLSKFDTEKKIFTNYFTNHFFPFSAFNERCILISKDNEIILSSLDGLLIMSERDFSRNTDSSTINLTSLEVNNKNIKPNDGTAILEQSILYANKIKLNHTHSVFSIEFTTSNYVKAAQSQIQYMLKNFDTEWINAPDYNKVTYTNLNPGKYTLIIRGLSSNNSDSITEKTLDIIIAPPFYRTWYAYLFYILVLFALLYLLYTRAKLRASLQYVSNEKQHIKELNQDKLRFFTNISHEIRTPATLIISQLELMLQEGMVSENIRHKLTNTLKNANNLKTLITELLDFRKQEQGYTKLEASEQDIIPFLDEVMLSFQDLARQKRIKTSFFHDKDSLPIWYNKEQLRKVFYNLLSNAFKFTPANGSVFIIVETQQDWVTITIKDNGIGIREEDLKNVFNRFFQGKINDSSAVVDSGTGIGLALADSIIKAHKGTISVQSNENKGSTFTVHLPLGDTHFTDLDKVEKGTILDLSTTLIGVPNNTVIHKKNKPEKQQVDQHSILIVEDNIDLLDVLVDIFKNTYKVYTANNGADGLEKATKLYPDIILSDIMMPEMSGIELCQKIKTNIDTCHIPIVLLTAKSSIESKMEGFQIGADDYVTKPFDSRILVSRCDNLINNRIMLQNIFRNSHDLDTTQLAVNQYDQDLLNKAISIIEEHIEDPDFNMSLFSEKMYMGRSSFFAKIKGLTGQTPRELITNIRLKKSKEMLLAQEEMTIGDISFQLGFSDPSYFTKVFKHEFGLTPHQFRTSNEKKN